MYRLYSIFYMFIVMLLVVVVCVTYSRMDYFQFSHESGFYEEEFELKIGCPRGGEIYYTLDSSEPDRSSLKYEGSVVISDATNDANVYANITDTSIGYQYERASQYFVSLMTPWYVVPDYKVDKCTIIKACYYNKKGHRSDTVTKVYFVGFGGRSGYDNLYVLSIDCKPSDLFDYEEGIYVCGRDMDEYLSQGEIASNWTWWRGNYSRRHMDGEREAHALLFNTNGDMVFDKTIGIRIQGNSSRAYMPKSLSLFSREEYDGTDYFPDVFENGYKAHGLDLFMGSQDYCTKVRDAIVNNLSNGLDVCSKEYRPAVLFLNGEYWGVYFITEKYDAEYFEHYYSQKKDNIAVVRNNYLEEGDKEYLEQYRSLMSFIADNDMALSDNYQYISNYIDMKSYADYYAIMIYVGRYNDWPKGNIGTWRLEQSDGYNKDTRWRYCLFDLNSGSLDIRYLDYDSIQYVIDEDITFANLCKNDDFVELFTEELVEVMENAYSDDKIQKQIRYFNDLLEEPMKVNNQRFFGSFEYTDPYEYTEDGGTFEEKLSNIEYYMINRKEIIYDLMEDHFGYKR